MTSASVPTALVVALLSTSSAVAQTAEPAIPKTVTTGLKVTITDDRGVMIDGRVENVFDQAMRLAVKGGPKDIPIEQIVRIEQPDGVKDGALRGFGIGAALGVVPAITAISGDSRGASFAVGSIIGNGVVCAGIGALIDAMVDGRKTLYQRGSRTGTRVSPVVGRAVRGVALSMRW